MTFEKHVLYDDEPDPRHHDVHWISGIYKVQFFSRLNDLGGAPGYAAYYIPTGWKNWGKRVDPTTQWYTTAEAAQAACEQHEKGAAHV